MKMAFIYQIYMKFKENLSLSLLIQWPCYDLDKFSHKKSRLPDVLLASYLVVCYI